MANILQATLTSGLGTGGTGTISTLDNLPNLQLNTTVSNGSTIAAVKAASTAPVTADPALVVSISPNSVNVNGQATMGNSSPTVIASNQSTVSVAQDTSQLAIGASGTYSAYQFVNITASSSGVTNILALVTSKKIRVVALSLTSNGAVNVKFQSHVTPTDITGLFYFAAAGDGIVLPFNPGGWFQTNSGEALDINLSGSVAVGGCLTYVTV